MQGHRWTLMWAAAAALTGTMGVAHALSGHVVATGLDQPIYLTAPTGDDRLFVIEKAGVIRVLSSGGVASPMPFLDLSASVESSGERGLLGLAFDPAYASNGRFYVNYIDKTTLNTVVARYTVSGNPNVANAASAQTVISIVQENEVNHKGGWIGFKPGNGNNLYIATGDGGAGNDPKNNAQNGQRLLGKLLRLDVSGNGAGYSIPTDNPFVGSATTASEIWALGLRNPWRNSFDRQTGDFWIADVGQGAREEINFEAANLAGGRNYGWRVREGTVATPGVGETGTGFTEPVFDYRHANESGLGDSIIGGYVYRGPSIADADGRYFFADFVSGRVFSYRPDADGKPTDFREDTAALLGGTGLSMPASFGEGGLGEIYLLGLNGTVVRLVPEPAPWLYGFMGLVFVGLARRRVALGKRDKNKVSSPDPS